MSDIFVVSKDRVIYDQISKHSDVTHITKKELTLEALDLILAKVTTDKFFVVQDKYDIPPLDAFPWDFVPDDDFVYRWNDQVGLLLFDTEAVRKNPDEFTDSAMRDGKYKFKDTSYLALGHTKYPAYLLSTEKDEAEDFLSRHPDVTHFSSDELTLEILEEINQQGHDMFAIVKGNQYFIKHFNFNFMLNDGDEYYVNAFDDSLSVLLFNGSDVRDNPEMFTDLALHNGQYKLKFHKSVLSIDPDFDTTLYVLSDKSNIEEAIPLHTDTLSLHALNVIKRTCKTPYFYVTKGNVETTIDITGPVKGYPNALTFWNSNDSIRLFKSRKVFKNIKGYTDEAWWGGKITDVANIDDQKIDVRDDAKMRHTEYDLVLLTRGWPEWCQKMAETYGEVTHIDSYDLNLKEVHEILDRCQSDYIYIVTNWVGNFDFDYKPPEYDERYLHIWNDDDTLRMIKRDVLMDRASYYTDQAVINGVSDVKSIYDSKVSFGELDIVFMSYDEPNADENYAKLKARFPRAKRVDGVTGILNAHKSAAHIATTPMFYVVDADAEIVDDFNFDYKPSLYDRDCVFTWRTINPCNGLKYGYGGVKLFPTKNVRDITEWNVDFTTSVSENFKAMEQVSNVTAFNTDAFSAWRSGFREGVKLSSGVIARQVDDETSERIVGWTKVALPVPFAEECRQGAQAGYLYGQKYYDKPSMLRNVNDYEWLKEQFENGNELVKY